MRALEAETRLQRLEIKQSNMNTAIITGLLLNTGLVLTAVAAGPAPILARGLLWAGGAGIVKYAIGVFKANAFEKKLVKNNSSGKKM